jgi:Bacterial Ig-like domain (group 3)/Beta-propeller repeat/Transmembrane protein 131-like N-terminal
MKRAYFVSLFRYFTLLCLTTSLFSQSNPLSQINRTAAVASPRVASPISASQASPQPQARILEGYGKLPLSFEANHGQADARVKFLSRTAGYTLFLTRDEAVLAWSGKKTKRTSPQRLKPASLAGPSGTAEPLTAEPVAAETLATEPAAAEPPARDLRFVSGYRFSDTASPRKPDAPSGAGQRPSTPSADAEVDATGGALRMKLRNANPAAKVTGEDELAGTSNYFIGKDPAKWRTKVRTYAKVKYEGIYPGIDLVYYGNQRQLEYDFIVAPGANPHRIAFDVHGAKRIRRDARGDLVLTMKMGEDEIRWHKPVVYQEKNGTRQEIAAQYAITDGNRVGFELAKYDVSKALYIDPLIYSTYLGGSNYDSGRAIAVDASGNAYVTGKTSSTDFPVTSGAFQTTRSGYEDVFVTKFNPTGSALVYSTYLGGSGSAGDGDIAAGIVVDGSGNAYVIGTTYSSDFPTTPGAFQTTRTTQSGYEGDAFVTKINPTGSALVYSSYLGGSSYNFGEGIAVDSAGSAYLTGGTDSTDFPITPGAFQTTPRGGTNGFVTKFNPTGSALVYSTYLGGSGGPVGVDHGFGVAVDSSGNAYVTGVTDSKDFPTTPGAFQSACDGGGWNCSPNAFVTKFNPTGSGLVYSTYLGGTDIDWGMGIAVDSSGNAYVAGTTYSQDFPTTSGGFQTTCGGGANNYSHCWDAFVTKINPDGSALVYSNYLGGTNDDWGIDITVDNSGQAYVIGYTESTDFPTKYPLQPSILGGVGAFVAKIDPDGSALAYSTYLGGGVGPALDYEGIYYMVEPALGIALDSSGNAYVTGQTCSYNFPTMKPLRPLYVGTSDAFVAKISAEPSDITLFPLHLDFRNQPMGVASNPQVSVLNNTGSTSLTIASISVTGTNSGDFAQTNNCGASLQPGTSCSITVTFTPVAIGNRIAAVKIVDSAPQQWVSLTGLGVLYTVTKLTSNKNPSALGQPVTLRATVSSPSGGTPTGFVYFRGPALNVEKALSAGTATFTTKKLPLGLDVLTAFYPGDFNYGFSTSAPVNQYVLEGYTTTALTSSPNPSIYGQAVTFTAVVTSSLGAPPDGETVSFMKGAALLGTEVLSGGSASFTTSALTVGTNNITAVYGGDSNLVGSKSKAVSQIVSKATTTTILTSSLNPSNFGQSVTFTATVTPQFSGTVKGTVTFYDGTTALKTVSASGGVAKYTTATLAQGTHTIMATYNGNANFTGSSTSLTQTVN